MSLTSHKTIGLDSRLLEIEKLFHNLEVKAALAAMERLEQEEFAPEGYNKGLYLLLLAERSMIRTEYQLAISQCQQAFEEIGSTNLNRRIGQLQLIQHNAYAALGDLKRAEMAARDCLASYRRVQDKQGIVDAYNALGRTYYFRSDYAMAAEYVQEAIQYADEDPVRQAQLLGNLGRIFLLTGELDKAEVNLRQSVTMLKEQDQPLSQCRNYLSLGYLQLRRRRFERAERELGLARVLIEENTFRREFIIYLEYMGELALEKQDFVAARVYLRDAVRESTELAPESTLLSQTLRRLAEAELALGHQNEAMTQVQKSLDLAQRIGEKAEIGLSHRVISAIFHARKELADARRHGLKGIDILREVGDNYELGRSIIAYGEIPLGGLSMSSRRILPLLQEAEKLFTLMGDDYYLARCHFAMGRYSQQIGKNSDALEYLNEAIKEFRAVGEDEGTRQVNEFLDSLSQSAINRALSDDNEYKVFGNVISNSEYNNLRSGSLDILFEVLINRTSSDRGFIVNMVQDTIPEISVWHGFDDDQREMVIGRFLELLDQSIASDRPTLILDLSRHEHLAELIPLDEGKVTSMITLPLILGTDIVGYIYLDRIAARAGQGINPFSQKDIDFSVGFADLAAFKTSEYQKERLLEDNLRLKAQLLEKCVFPNIITQSRTFMEILARVRQVSNSNMAISIYGETGTGKDLLAKAIHYNSNRRDKRFISVNCAALPESLLESELFGYKKGAFTGADRDKPGLFEEADGGTFFLDEIADMPLSIQAKLLRVLENQEITRLGDTRPRKVDVRVLSATNKDLKHEMENKTFRSDLFYRLCALHFRIPALRERKEDVPLLVDHFLTESNCQISPDAMKYMIDYDWPGNVRELENEVKKLVLLANNEGQITPLLLSSRILGDDKAAVDNNPDEMAFYNKDGFSLYDYLAEYEKRFIIKALKEQGGIKKRAADSLQIPESTLRLKLKQYKIDPKRLDTIN